MRHALWRKLSYRSIKLKNKIHAGSGNRTHTPRRTQDFKSWLSTSSNIPALLSWKATSGIEPLNKGFADLCLTTWLRRQNFYDRLNNLFFWR